MTRTRSRREEFSAALVVLRRTALVDSKQTDDAGLGQIKTLFDA